MERKTAEQNKAIRRRVLEMKFSMIGDNGIRKCDNCGICVGGIYRNDSSPIEEIVKKCTGSKQNVDKVTFVEDCLLYSVYA